MVVIILVNIDIIGNWFDWKLGRFVLWSIKRWDWIKKIGLDFEVYEKLSIKF